ncbi:hypothetical protein L1987_42063 [Smallanthus sonchifolius]|uniref:Uncharacterized protein n=1 Tax=Smallanthus sonchifolius TaxID=185202 RepID=A0ACB9GWH2_9ASTR|nr:hypothetical protein L1987_42063 [Smallanthus sonchifolius]
MPRKDTDTLWILILMALLSCLLSFMFVSVILRSKFQEPVPLDMEDAADGGCCRGVDGLELWGSVVMWGSDFKLSSPLECCEACKATCAGNDDFCLCDSWVFCSDPKGCGPKFGEVAFSSLTFLIKFSHFYSITSFIVNRCLAVSACCVE